MAIQDDGKVTEVEETPEMSKPALLRLRLGLVVFFAAVAAVYWATGGQGIPLGAFNPAPVVAPAPTGNARFHLGTAAKGVILEARCISMIEKKLPQYYSDDLTYSTGTPSVDSPSGDDVWPILKFTVYRGDSINYPLSAFLCTGSGPVIFPNIQVSLRKMPWGYDWQ